MLSWPRQDRSTVRSFFQQVPVSQVRPFPVSSPKPIEGGESNDEDEKKAICEDCEVTEDPQVAKISENEGKRIHKKKYQVEDTEESIIGMFGEINQLKRVLKKILSKVNEEHDAVEDGGHVIVDGGYKGLPKIIERFQENLNCLQKLKSEFQKIVRQKRIKLDQIDRIASSLVVAQDQKKQLELTVKQKDEQLKRAQMAPIRPIAKHEMMKVPMQFQTMVVQCLETYSNMVLKDGFLECTCCRDEWFVSGLRSVPSYKITINSSTVFSTKRHCTASETHLTCTRARNKFDARNNFYLRHIQEAKSQAKAMTMNIHRAVYFLLKNDLSMRLFEAIVELLDCCKTLIGNQLHSRKTARTIALMIDEMYQANLIRYLLSEKVDEFSLICDELTDVGGLKTLLSKFRFFENEWDLQEMTFSIFESCGSSDEMLTKFTEDFILQFQTHTALTEQEIVDILALKLGSGGSDRASKILKFAAGIQAKFGNSYVHFPCDNHMTETA